MKLVDSKEQKLSYNQVLLGAIENMKSSGQIPENVSRKDAAAKIVQEIGSKNVQTVQIGNSIFVGVYNKEKDIVQVVERVKGKRVYNDFPAWRTFYIKDPRGEYTSIHGEKVVWRK